MKKYLDGFLLQTLIRGLQLHIQLHKELFSILSDPKDFFTYFF